MKKINLNIFLAILGSFILGCVITAVIAFSTSGNDIPVMFNIKDTNATYTIDYFKDSGGAYHIRPFGDDLYEQDSYISYSPVPLDQFLGKKVKITGQFVLTTKTLEHAGYPTIEWNPPVGAVRITSIHLMQ
jgi:hypothetical protein